MVDKSGLTEVEKTGKNHYFLVWKQGPGAYSGRVKVTLGEGRERSRLRPTPPIL